MRLALLSFMMISTGLFASGSSEVTRSNKHYSVTFFTPRKVFEPQGPEDSERHYHETEIARFKKLHDKYAVSFNQAYITLDKEFSILTDYNEKAPELSESLLAQSGGEEADYNVIVTFFRPETGRFEITVKTKPDRKVLARLKDRLREILNSLQEPRGV